jgi:bis(5'-nucleosyl)-tetraphosphatase (symmetrical)
MPVWAIGDLQGCLDPLDRLLEHIRFDPASDTLWFCGDLVNRGPRSLETLRRVRDLGDRAVSVLGNHDLHLLAVATGKQRKLKRKDTLDDILAAPDRDELLEWLRHRPLMHHDPEIGYTMVHAGLPPAWGLEESLAAAGELESCIRSSALNHFVDEMYGNLPDQWSPELQGMERLRYITNCFTRLRYCRSDGRLDLSFKGAPEHAPADVLPWFRVPERRSAELSIVFGHWSTLGPVTDPGIFPLDTGCVWGGRLTAMRLDENRETVHTPCGPGLTPGLEG